GYESREHSFRTPRYCLFPPESASADWKRYTPAYFGNRWFAQREEYLPSARYPPCLSWKGHSPRSSAYKAIAHCSPYSATCNHRKHRNAYKKPRSDTVKPLSAP